MSIGIFCATSCAGARFTSSQGIGFKTASRKCSKSIPLETPIASAIHSLLDTIPETTEIECPSGFGNKTAFSPSSFFATAARVYLSGIPGFALTSRSEFWRCSIHSRRLWKAFVLKA